MSARTGQAGGLRFLGGGASRRCAKGGGRPPLWTPLVEESQPSGLSGPYAHAPCWLKVSLSLELRCRAPQLPPAVLSGPKSGQGRNFVKKSQNLEGSQNGLAYSGKS